MADFFSIYVLKDPTTLEIRYVGQTTQTLEKRLRSHVYYANRKNKNSNNSRWLRRLARYGLTPVITLVQELPIAYYNRAEVYWIQYFRSIGCRLTNSTDGGEGVLGHVWTPESRAKMSSARRGKANLKLRGRKFTTDHVEKLRAGARRQFENPSAREAVSRVHKGKKISEVQKAIIGAATTKRWLNWRMSGAVVSADTRAKIRAARKGKVLNAETKVKISLSLKGRPHSPAHREKLTRVNQERARHIRELNHIEIDLQ